MLPAIRNNGSAPATAPVNRVSNIFDRFFEDVFAPLAAPSWGAWDATFPMSMWEDEDAVRVELDAPGVTEKDIELTVHDGELIVRGERKTEEKTGGYDTRVYGRFERRVSLPATVDADKVEAKLANGVLSVTCPKSEAAKPRKIAIAAPKSEPTE
jgi:HSP20 family protein